MLNPDGPDTQISRHLKIDFWKCHKTQTAFSSSQANVEMNPCKPIGNEPVGHEPVGNEPVGHDPEGNKPVGHKARRWRPGQVPRGHDPTGYEPVGHDPEGNEPVGYKPVGYETVDCELGSNKSK